MIHNFKFISCIILFAVLVFVPTFSSAADGDDVRLKPFVYAYSSTADMQATAADVRARLESAGFSVVGEYSPYDGVLDIAVTSAALQQASSASDFGNFAAVQRVSLTRNGDAVEVIYTNPLYMALAYRLSADLGDIRAALEVALGAEYTMGSDKGLKISKLPTYRYMGFPMYTERFDEPDLLATYASHEDAVTKMEEGLAAGSGGVSRVYRVDVEGTSDTLFGVGMSEGCSGDEYLMSRIDFADTRSSAHLPYEVLVKDNEIWALGARFRIAISFPDLSMMGKRSFASIMCAPGSIKDALRAAAGNP
jgi:hypothetical protein